VTVDISLAIVSAVSVGVLTVLGGLLSAKVGWHRKVIWAVGSLATILAIVQAIRQVQAQDSYLRTITGGNSFCFVRVTPGNEGLYPLVLNSGNYPVYDLSVRLWDPEEWKSDSVITIDTVWPKVAAETVQLGTLPNDDYRRIAKIPLPTNNEAFAIEFSARNGSWRQSLLVRRSPQGWKTASVVRHSRKVGTEEEITKAGTRICYYVDTGFPLQSADELKNWMQDVPICAPGSHSKQ
jgi:hypothetical protein